MSSARRRFVIVYILLVGVPLLGIVGVLKAGRHLTAPISVNGTWSVSADSAPLSPGPCGEGSSLSHSSLVISQSGKNLSLAFDGSARASGDGSLEGATVKAPLQLMRDASRGAGCAAAQPLTLTASVNPQSDPRSLTGSITVDGCAACAPVAFHALLQPRTKPEGVH
jgi:hypothetical protein